MSNTLHWWQQESPYFLNETLAFINSSRSREDAIGRCEDLCKALNKSWNAFFQFRNRIGELNETEQLNDTNGERSDTQSFREFLLRGIDHQRASALCGRKSLRCFAEFAPQIMNHEILLRNRYDPLNITEALRIKASGEHRQLLNAFERFAKMPSDILLKQALLKKAATLIYVVRSNIAHSEKTPQGPDVGKSERDRLVSEVTAKVIEDVFDILFDGPSQRLAVYGTLTPDAANASQLAGLEGQWHDGEVTGVLDQRHGLMEFVWSVGPEAVPVKVFSAPDLFDQFNRLDRFEGPRYQRIMVPVLIDGQLSVCNIYQGKRKAAKN